MVAGFNFSNGKLIRKWNEMREQVISSFILNTTDVFDVDVQEDTYNSVAIEGYDISRELVNNVISDDWSSDCHNKEELVIRGYYQAFQKVRDSIIRIKENHLNLGEVIEADFMDWYIEMWQPFVAAGILKHSDIIGYRNRPVYIKNSRHVPPASHKVLDYMDEYFECLKNETYASVRAILGHFFLTWIHPFNDGNGRMARFVMNSMLTTGGYPWVIVPVSKRNDYMAALEKASITGDITEFSKLIANC